MLSRDGFIMVGVGTQDIHLCEVRMSDFETAQSAIRLGLAKTAAEGEHFMWLVLLDRIND